MKPNSRLSVNQLIDYGIRLVQESQPDAARPFFEKALEREPRNTAALLWLAGLSETSAKGYRLLVQTLEIDPKNERARAAIRWNYWREQDEKMRAAQQASGVAPADRMDGDPKQEAASHITPAWLGLLAALIVIGGAIASIYFGQPLPVSATVAQANVATQEVAQLAPNATPPPLATRTLPPTSTPLATATLPPTQAPTATPTLPPTEFPTATPLPPTDTPEPPTPLPAPPLPAAPTAIPVANVVNPTGSSTEHWIDVDLGNQRLVAYEGDTPVYWVTVSTGLSWHANGHRTISHLREVSRANDERPRLLFTRCPLRDVLLSGLWHSRHVLAQQLRPTDEPRLRQHAHARRAVVVQLGRSGYIGQRSLLIEL